MFNFLQIVELLNAVYCLAELLEFAAFLNLRLKYPHLHRPYRIPLPTWGCALLLTPAFLLLSFMLLLPMLQGDLSVVLFTLGATAIGAALYPALQKLRQAGWCDFKGQTPEEFQRELTASYAPSVASDENCRVIADVD
jgi:amino acid transporter